MVFLNNIPQITDSTDKSSLDFLGNNVQLNTSFGQDHHPFDDQTGDAGKHNVVQTPLIIGAAHPATSANEPKYYAMNAFTPPYLLNWSRGPSNAVPTPVTFIQNETPLTIVKGATSNILDFTGILRAIFHVSVGNLTANGEITPIQYSFVQFNGTDFNIINRFSFTPIPGVNINILYIDTTSTGTILQLKNTTTFDVTQIFYTIDFARLE